MSALLSLHLTTHGLLNATFGITEKLVSKAKTFYLQSTDLIAVYKNNNGTESIKQR